MESSGLKRFMDLRRRILEREKRLYVRLILYTAVIGLVFLMAWFYRSPSLFRPVEIKVKRVTESQRFGNMEAHEGGKYITITFRLICKRTINYPVVPLCFQVATSEGKMYYSLPQSPLFLQKSQKFYLRKGEVIENELVFLVPKKATAAQLLFSEANSGV